MSIAKVQSTSKDAGAVTSTTLAFASSVTSGSLLLASGRAATGTVTVTCSDNVNAGNYAADGSETGNSQTLFLQSMPNAGAGATTVTCALGSAQTLRLIIQEFSGVAASSPLDGTPVGADSGGASNTSPSSGNLTTANASDLLVGIIICGNGNGALTAGSGWTLDQSVVNKAFAEYQIVSATGSYAANGTLAASDNWNALIAAYKAAAGGSNTTVTPRVA